MTRENGGEAGPKRKEDMMDEKDGKDKAHVPKFSSFKPKLDLKTEHRTGRHHDSSRERSPERHRRHADRHGHERRRDDSYHSSIARDSRRHHKEHPSSSSSHHHHHHHHDNRRHHRHDRASIASARHESIDPRHRKEEPDLYVFDTKGDQYNVVYGSLHQYDVPRYHRTGRGRVLGVPLKYCIDRDSLDGKTMVLRSHAEMIDDGSARKRQNAAWKQARNITTLYRVRRDTEANAEEELQSDFLRLDSEMARKRRRVNDGYSSVSEDEVNYRSIEGKAKASLPADIALESELTPDDDASGIAARLRNAELSKQVADHPNDIDAWLALIDHQETLVGTMSVDDNRVLTASEKRSIADIRLSIYEKALAAVSAKLPRDRLVLGLLGEGGKLWDTKLLAKKWQHYLQQYPGYMSLWVRYLDFQQTNFLNFSYEKCRDFIISCIDLNKSSTLPRSTAEQALAQKKIHLYLLLRLGLLMRESGFCEHAVAIWQGLLEFNIFRPKSLSSHDMSAAVASFNTFWDSEVPRIGEPGAKGWDSSAGTKPAAPQADEAPLAINPHSPFESWEHAEWNQMRASFLPARTLDETQEDDPYRVILSSDTEKLLADFTGPVMQDLLLNSFLLFCRLPPFSHSSSTILQWRTDPFVFNEYLDTRSDIGAPWFSRLFTDPETRTASVANNFPLQNVLCTPETLFADEQWFSVFQSFRDLHSKGTSTLLPTAWIRRAIRHLVGRLPDNDRLAEYSAALEYICNPADAKVYVKRLLKQRPSCKALYNCYVLMELRDGQFDSAERVVSTTLSMSARQDEMKRDGCTSLWVSWIWGVLKQGKFDKVMRLLAAIPDNQIDGQGAMQTPGSTVGMTPAEILKSQKFFTEVADYGLATSKENSFINATECLAVLRYTTSDRDLQQALQVYGHAETNLSRHASFHGNASVRERLHQCKANLLYHHALTRRVYKPSVLREELQRSISLFPSNTMFLGLFVWNESKFRMDDRVRSIMRHHTSSSHRHPQQQQSSSRLNQDTQQDTSRVIPHLYTIFSELHRGVSAGSTTHSVRAAFEAALLAESPARSQPLLWKLYISFECAVAQGQRAREVFFRALRACPWVKELVLLAFREDDLRRGIASTRQNGDAEGGGRGQLRKVWNVLVEKELRVHVDLEEWFED
ncbi:snoRNA-binding rRNA-processing protein utp10 [Ascosphaera pollenicola]|nr:snoRNA-binding rRNA-processing protein utp10 [Ascosphaera pollenicola]